MTEHARYSPSQLPRIIDCPGSVRLSDHVPPQPSTDYAIEGTLLHEITAECIERRPDYDLNSVSWEKPEHKFLVAECLGNLDGLLAKFVTFDMINETRVYMKDIDVNGTLDVGIFGTKANGEPEIHIVDFKFGGGVPVSPTDNAQLMAYLDGFCASIGFNYELNRDVPMFVWIYQPRMDFFDCERVFAEELIYFRRRVEKTIRLAESHNPPLRPGIEQCRWCAAGGACKARISEAVKDMNDIMAAVADPINWEDQLESVENLAKILQLKNKVEQALESTKAYLFSLLRNGKKVPGYKLVVGRNSRTWAAGVDAFSLNEQFPELDTTDLVTAELRSPAQVEKMLVADKEMSKADKKKALAELIISTPGAPTMALESSAKAALDTTAQGTFKDVVGD